MAAAEQKKSPLRRALPLVKFAIAGAMIAFVLWLVPIQDHLFLPGPDQQADRSLSGTIVERDGARVVFEGEGGRLVVLFEVDDDSTDAPIVAVELESGKIYHPPPTLQEARKARLETGILTVARNASVPHLLLATLLVGVGAVVAVYRWTLLLLGAGLATSFGRAFNLTFIGLFFSNIMPGLTGGDVVKAVYIAREHRDSRTEAILTVLLDRILGITGLAVVAGLVIPSDFGRYAEVAPWIYGFLGVELVCGCIFFSHRLRRAVRLDSLVGRLPLSDVFKKIDQAVFLYRFRRRLLVISLALSVCVHLIIISGIGIMGVGIGLAVPLSTYYAVIPICLIVMALPMTPAGWGVGEAAFIYFLAPLGVGASSALALALVYRMAQLAVSLIGGVCLALQKDRVSSQEVERFTEDRDRTGLGTDRGQVGPPPGSDAGD